MKMNGSTRETADTRTCNSCGGAQFSVMGVRSDAIKVLRCATCGLGVVESIPSDLASYYGDSYYLGEAVDSEIGYQDYRFTAEHGLAWAASLIELLRQDGRVLDIGCADGTLLLKLPAQFEKFGIEVNRSMSARATVGGVSILAHDLFDPVMKKYRGYFDVVSCIAVFEHLTDFRLGMQISLELLKPDGFLIFETPFISAEKENKIWFESSLEHVYYPSAQSLQILVEELGAHLVGREVYIQDYASNYIGVAFRNREQADKFKSLFDALTSTQGALPNPEHQARQMLMLAHAAVSTPDLVSGIAEIPAARLNHPLLQRIEQLWSNDLRRLAAARQETQKAVSESIRQLSVTSALQEELARQVSVTSALQEELARSAINLLKMEAQIGDLEAAAQEFRAQSADMLFAVESELASVRRQLAAVVNSSAWKLTFPLRSFGARHRNVARLFRWGSSVVWWSLRFELGTRLREALRRRRSRIAPASIDPALLLPAKVSLPALEFEHNTGILEPVSTDDEVDPWPDTRPLVSVVVTAFNYGRFVAEAVDSVLNQTFKNLEVIVIEGGSTDPKSRETTLGLERPRTRVIPVDEPTFTGANRNHGISLARGKYVCCLDADDKLAPTYIEKALFLLETCGYDVVSTATQCCGRSAERVDIVENPTLTNMLDANHLLTCAVFRRSLWRKAGGFRDTKRSVTGHIHEDWMFWARIALLGARMRNISKEYLFLYRIHGQSLSTAPDIHPEEVHRALIRQANSDLEGLASDEIAVASNAEQRDLAKGFNNLLSGPPELASRPTLLLALPFTILGGAERLLSTIVAHLASKGWRIIITTSIEAGPGFGDTTSWFALTTTEIYHLPRFLPEERWQSFVRYLITSRSVDILWVVGSAFIYELLPLLKSEFPKLHIVDLLFNTIGHTENNRKYSHLIDSTFVENREVLDFLTASGVPASRVALNPSGIDLDVYQPSERHPEVVRAINAEPDHLIIGCSGRWSEEKNPLAFVQIAARTLDLPLTFVMTGTGAMRGAIEKALRKADLPTGRFHLIGEVSNVIPWLQSFDILILPSKLDGRPVVVLEALALGVPVIASRVGGLPELVENGVNGFLCQPDDLESFVVSLRKCAEDGDLLRRLKGGARATALAKLDAKTMLTEYETQLSKIIGNAKN